MSLINDALKRANQTQKQRPPAPSLGVPLTPVDGPRKGPLLAGWMVPALCVVLVLVGSWFLWSWWKASRPPSQVAEVGEVSIPKTLASHPAVAEQARTTPMGVTAVNPKPTVAIRVSTNLVVRTNAGVPVAPTPVASPTPPPAQPPVAADSASKIETRFVPGTAAREATNVAAAAIPAPGPAAVVFPPLKLQGIHYRLAKPSAMINGETVYVGEDVEGVKILRIERRSVTVEKSSQAKVLYLGNN